MFPFGTHVTIGKTLSQTFDEMREMRIKNFQVFLGNPQSYTPRQVSDADIEVCKTKKSRMFIHASYCLSLCNPPVIEKSYSTLTYQLGIAGKMGCSCGGVVVHPGSCKDTQKGLYTVIDTISHLYRENSGLGTLLLENSCGQGTTLPHTLEQLQFILEHLDNCNVGVCIDTCHSFAAGMTDFSDSSSFYRKVEETIGIENVKLIHLNDSIHPFLSRKDRHQTLGKGCIWTSSEKLVDFVNTFQKVPMVTETGTFIEDIEFVSN
jgi:deoxyribonuclease-4